MRQRGPKTAIKEWQERLGLTDTKAAGALGLPLREYRQLKRGLDDEGRPVECDSGVARQCRAIEAKLKGTGSDSPPLPWCADQVALLGSNPDAAVAAAVGRSRNATTLARWKRGIPPSEPSRAPSRVWDDQNNVALLGKLPDQQIADQLGLHVSSVWTARTTRGISPVVARPGRQAGVERWTPEAIALLGTAPDSEIAERLGITRAAVHRARQRRGIAPFRSESS